MRFESLASSGLRALLSNPAAFTLNGCAKMVQYALPHRCVLCDSPTGQDWICADCDAELPRLPPGCCTVCAVPLPFGEICGACLRQPPVFESVQAAFAYECPVDVLIYAFKYGRRPALAPVLGEMLASGAAPERETWSVKHKRAVA